MPLQTSTWSTLKSLHWVQNVPYLAYGGKYICGCHQCSEENPGWYTIYHLNALDTHKVNCAVTWLWWQHFLPGNQVSSQWRSLHTDIIIQETNPHWPLPRSELKPPYVCQISGSCLNPKSKECIPQIECIHVCFPCPWSTWTILKSILMYTKENVPLHLKQSAVYKWSCLRRTVWLLHWWIQ